MLPTLLPECKFSLMLVAASRNGAFPHAPDYQAFLHMKCRWKLSSKIHLPIVWAEPFELRLLLASLPLKPQNPRFTMSATIRHMH
jgi:hypothetical protein